MFSHNFAMIADCALDFKGGITPRNLSHQNSQACTSVLKSLNQQQH